MSSETKALEAINAYKAIFAVADAEGRDLTASEKRAVEKHLAIAERYKNASQVEQSFGGFFGDAPAVSGYNHGVGPGDVFIRSDSYKSVRYADSRPQQWSSGPVEVPMEFKGTLLETTAGGPGGGWVPPFYQPGAVAKLFEPLGVEDLFGQSNVTASQVRYVNEGTATNAAAGVAEAGVKPESLLNYAEVIEPVKKVATVLPISDEFLEDAPSVQSYLNSRLVLFVKLEEERQLLRGAGTNELVGIHGRSGINTYTKLGTDDNATALARVIANTAGSANLQPTGIIMHPTNWLSTRLLRDGTGGTIGNFYGAGPFGPSGNNAGAAGLFGQAMWNLPVALSTHVGVVTALVGNFREGAHIWRRGAVSVEASNSHSDYWVRNLVSLRAESRLALGLYRSNAVTEIRGLV